MNDLEVLADYDGLTAGARAVALDSIEDARAALDQGKDPK